jgi:hypothetical protein
MYVKDANIFFALPLVTFIFQLYIYASTTSYSKFWQFFRVSGKNALFFLSLHTHINCDLFMLKYNDTNKIGHTYIHIYICTLSTEIGNCELFCFIRKSSQKHFNGSKDNWFEKQRAILDFTPRPPGVNFTPRG